MTEKHTVLILTDSVGRIIGLAQPGRPDGDDITGIQPLPGQLLHEVEAPSELLGAYSAHDLYEWTLRNYVAMTPQAEIRPFTEFLQREIPRGSNHERNYPEVG